MSQVLIRPRKERGEAPIGPVAVMVAIEKDLALMRRAMGIRGNASRRILTSRLYEATHGGHKIALAGPMLGAPYSVMILEKLIALGAKRVIFFGWCGSLQKDARIGDLIVPNRGVTGEGTSKYYGGGEQKADPEPSGLVKEAIEKTLEDYPMSFHEGPVWSTDAPYRETKEMVLSLQKEGILAVDMEVSALFNVAEFRGVELGILLVVSDELGSLRWKPGFSTQQFNKSRQVGIEMVCRACMRL